MVEKDLFKNTSYNVSDSVMFRMTDLNFSSWVAVLTPNDRPKSVRSRCVIEVLVPFLCCHFAFSKNC